MKQKILNLTTNFLFEYFGFMVLGLVVGLFVVNHDQTLYHSIMSYAVMDWLGMHLTVEFLFRDPVITGFFGLIIAHILIQKINGDFQDRSAIVQPIAGAVGGVLGPMVLYIVLIFAFGFKEALIALPVVAATDIAFSLLVGSINHKKNSKTVIFLKLLAIADDIIIILLSIFLPNPEHPFNVWGLGVVAIVAIAAWGLFKIINIPWKQVVLAVALGACMWNALLFTGLHPILAFVFILPFAVKNHPKPRQASGRKAMKKFEKLFKIPVDVGLFGFGFVSGGIYITGWEMLFQPFTLIILISIVLGKSIGIPLAAKLVGGKAYTPKEQVEAGILGGVGFTVAILMAQMLLKGHPILREQATIGAVLSLFVVLLIQLTIWIYNKAKQSWELKVCQQGEFSLLVF